MIDLDDFIKPYADSQPNRVPTNSEQLSRFPPLADANGINPKFQKFFEMILKVFTPTLDEGYLALLYVNSDRSLIERDFVDMCINCWSKHFDEYNSAKTKNIDIELNMDRFSAIHRNIIGGFFIITYHVNVNDDEFGSGKVTEFKQARTELLFTFKGDQFQIISHITPFVISE